MPRVLCQSPQQISASPCTFRWPQAAASLCWLSSPGGVSLGAAASSHDRLSLYELDFVFLPIPTHLHPLTSAPVCVRESLSCVWLFVTRPHGLQPTRLLCPWGFLGRNTGVCCYVLLQGIFPTQGWNPSLLHWQMGSLPHATWEAPCPRATEHPLSQLPHSAQV